MNSSKMIYNWERYWVPYGCCEGSYWKYSSLYDNEKSTLSNLRDKL